MDINEGRQVILDDINIHGSKNLYKNLIDKASFFKHFPFKSKTPLILQEIKKQRDWILQHLKHKGYLYATVDYEIVNLDSKTVLVFKISEDKQVKFGKTIIIADDYVNYSLILNQLTYKYGEVFNKSQLDSSLKNLKSLSVFERAVFSVADDKTSKEEKNIILRLCHDDPFEIKTRIGFQTISRNFDLRGGTTYKIGGSLLWKNPLRMLDVFKFEADVTTYKKDIVCSYELPKLPKFPVKTALKVYSIRYDQPVVVGSKQILYIAYQDGFLANFLKDINKIQFGLTCGAEWINICGLSVNSHD